MVLDVCVVTYRNTADRVRPAVREKDRLWVRDNTHDNVGFARAANELAAKGDQALILFVNPDGDPEPGCFDHLEACATAEGVVAASATLGPAFGGMSDVPGWLVATCMVVHRDTFEKVGRFDESLFLYGEDMDLGWRLAEIGRLVVCQSARFQHDTMPRSWRAGFWETRNGFRVRRRWGRPVGMPEMVRAALGNLRDGLWRLGSARLAGAAVFVCLDRRWS